MTKRDVPASRTALSLLTAALLLGSALAAPAFAQDAAAPAAEAPAAGAAAPADIKPGDVVATVGDMQVTEADLSFAAEDLGQELGQVPPEQRKAFLLSVVIDMKVMASEARKQQLDQTDIFKMRLNYLADRALRRAYFAEKIATGVKPEDLQAAYDTMVKSFTPADEVHARHILVATKEEADAIEADLKAGKDFAQIATEKSIDPSGKQNGGDLGFFQHGMMVKPFEDAAFALEPGQVSEPVQSQFGWHIIKLEEKRKTEPPKLQDVSAQLQQSILLKSFDDAVNGLKQGIDIKIPDQALAAQVAQQNEQAAATAQ